MAKVSELKDGRITVDLTESEARMLLKVLKLYCQSRMAQGFMTELWGSEIAGQCKGVSTKIIRNLVRRFLQAA